MPERHYGLIIASLVAVVAVVGLVLNFSGMTGAATSPTYFVSETAQWFEAGEQIYDKCRSDLETIAKQMNLVKGESLSETQCSSFLCGELCSGLSQNCYSGCKSGADMKSKEVFNLA